VCVLNLTFVSFICARIIPGGSLKVAVTVAKNRANNDDDDVDDANKESSDAESDASEPFEDLNLNSNNGNDLPGDGDTPLSPTICVYGSSGMAGPFDLDISGNVDEISDESYCESNVRNF